MKVSTTVVSASLDPGTYWRFDSIQSRIAATRAPPSVPPNSFSTKVPNLSDGQKRDGSRNLTSSPGSSCSGTCRSPPKSAAGRRISATAV